MPDELTDFIWTVFKSYEWITRRHKGEKVRVLTDGVPVNSLGTGRRYLPLSRFSGLFLTFALDVEPSEKSIHDFASKYGALGLYGRVQLPSDGGEPYLGTGELSTVWTGELADMRAAVTLWDAARAGRSEELGRLIHWNDAGVYYQDDRGEFSLIAGGRTRPDVLTLLHPGDLVAPAYWHLQEVINRKLDRHRVTGRVLWDVKDRTGKQLAVRLVPKNLIGALWLQFAKALEGRDYRQCEFCKLWFEIGGSRSARSDKRFCTPTCKAAAHRNKERTDQK